MRSESVVIADNCGFCFGVDRAVKMVREAAVNGKVATLGEIIHNRDIIREFSDMGVRVIDDPCEILENETLIIRSHGVPKKIYDILNKENIVYKDATCPFVEKIQEIVREKSAAGNDILILGDKNHAEIKGIVGFFCDKCDNSYQIFSNYVDLSHFLTNYEIKLKKNLDFLVQTTYNIEEWEKCVQLLSNECENITIHDTICRASHLNQKNAEELAKKSFVMLVVGGQSSANTHNLYEICKKYCDNTYKIENAAGLTSILPEILAKIPHLISYFDGKIAVGITSGASTPNKIIQEVWQQMAEEIKKLGEPGEDIDDEGFNFEEEIAKSMKKVRSSERITGVVASINSREVIVDIGTKHSGFIPLSELNPEDQPEVGDTIEVVVTKIDDVNGTVSLSRKKLNESQGYDVLKKANAEGTILSGTIFKVINGGVLVSTVNNQRVFIPASLLGCSKETDLGTLVKKTVQFKIIEVNESRRRALGSVKAVSGRSENTEASNKFWEEVQVGDVFPGKVKSFTTYGAFVNIGAVDGMIHISELSFSRISHPKEVLSIGEEIEVYVKSANKEKHKLSLGYKKSENNPWLTIDEHYHVGDVVEAKIVSLVPFGAFARITDGVDGLIHNSQIADKPVANPETVVKPGDIVKARIISIDMDKKRMNLSLKTQPDKAEPEITEAE